MATPTSNNDDLQVKLKNIQDKLIGYKKLLAESLISDEPTSLQRELQYKIIYLEGKIKKLNFMMARTDSATQKSIDTNKDQVLKFSSNTTSSISLEDKGLIEKKKDLKIEPNRQYFLYACEVMHDGLGDLGHFIDIAKTHGQNKDGLESYRPLYIVRYENQNDKDKIESELKQNGFDLNSPEFHLIHPPTEFKDYLQDNVTLQQQLANSPAMLNISTYYFDANSPGYRPGGIIYKFLEQHDKKIACTSIGEHQGMKEFKGGIGSFQDNWQILYRFLGIGFGEFGEKNFGFLLNKNKVKNKKENQRELRNIKNKDFLKALISTKASESATDNKTLLETFKEDEFLKQTLIIPGYYHHFSKGILDLINMTTAAPITESYKEYVLVLNKGNTFEDSNEYLKNLSPDIKSIQITTKDNDNIVEKTILNPNHNPHGKCITVRLLEGFWLEKSDYDILYQNAQLFAGFAGDKTFENVLSYNLIPYPQVRHNKVALFKELANWTEAVLKEELETGTPDLVSPYIKCVLKRNFQDAGQYLKPEFARQWDIISESIFDNYNAYDELPYIKRQCLARGLEFQATQAAKNKTGLS